MSRLTLADLNHLLYLTESVLVCQCLCDLDFHVSLYGLDLLIALVKLAVEELNVPYSIYCLIQKDV